MLNTLLTNDVRQTLDQFRHSVDQMFDNFYGYRDQSGASSPSGERTWTFSPIVESGWERQLLDSAGDPPWSFREGRAGERAEQPTGDRG